MPGVDGSHRYEWPEQIDTWFTKIGMQALEHRGPATSP